MLNLAFGWIWITAGFVSGAMLGMGFHKENFMGGYGSWERRLARLGHIAFFGTGFLNVLFGLTQGYMGHDASIFTFTSVSWLFIVGGVSMPICCFIAARNKELKSIFAIPVIALTLGGILIAMTFLYMLIMGGIFSVIMES